MKTQQIKTLLLDTFSAWQKDNVPRMSAALSYYTVFSLAPLLIIIISVAGIFLGQDAAQGNIVAQMQSLIGQSGATFIQDILKNASKPEASSIAAVIGVITLVLGASGVFSELQSSLNTIWGVKPDPKKGIWGAIKDRFLSFTLVIGVAFLLLVSLSVDAVLSALNDYIASLLSSFAATYMIQGLSVLISFLLITVLFGLIYKVLPDRNLKWRHVIIGALVTSFLFTIGKFLIGLYIGNSNFTDTYGAAGSLIVILLWVFYASSILFLGAEFTKVYVRSEGAKVETTKGARVRKAQ
ncbi:MAG: YihY/virulence factor BrkB family protein [Candidatus Gracilibacteria bacterium]